MSQARFYTCAPSRMQVKMKWWAYMGSSHRHWLRDLLSVWGRTGTNVWSPYRKKAHMKPGSGHVIRQPSLTGDHPSQGPHTVPGKDCEEPPTEQICQCCPQFANEKANQISSARGSSTHVWTLVYRTGYTSSWNMSTVGTSCTTFSK